MKLSLPLSMRNFSYIFRAFCSHFLCLSLHLLKALHTTSFHFTSVFFRLKSSHFHEGKDTFKVKQIHLSNFIIIKKTFSLYLLMMIFVGFSMFPLKSQAYEDSYKCYTDPAKQKSETEASEKSESQKREAFKQIDQQFKEIKAKVEESREQFDAKSQNRIRESEQKAAACAESFSEAIKAKRATLADLDKACKVLTKEVCKTEFLGRGSHEVCQTKKVGGPDSTPCKESKKKVPKLSQEVQQLKEKESKCRSAHSQFKKEIRQARTKLDSNHEKTMSDLRSKRDKASKDWYEARQKLEQAKICLANLPKFSPSSSPSPDSTPHTSGTPTTSSLGGGAVRTGSSESADEIKDRLYAYQNMLERCERRSSNRENLKQDFPEFWKDENRKCQKDTDCMLAPTNCCATIDKALPGQKGYVSLSKKRWFSETSYRRLGMRSHDATQHVNFAEVAGEFQREQNCQQRLGVTAMGFPGVSKNDERPWWAHQSIWFSDSFKDNAELKCVQQKYNWLPKCVNNTCQAVQGEEMAPPPSPQGGQR